MFRKRVLLTCCFLFLYLLSGCNKANKDDSKIAANSSPGTESSVGENNPTAGIMLNSELSADKIVVRAETEASAVFEEGANSPIVSSGAIVGGIKVNYAEKIGIWDLYSAKAITAGVKESYALNVTVDMSEYLKKNKMVSIECTPSLLDAAGNVIGEPCVTGWSGFSNRADLFTKNPVDVIEVNLQPIVTSIPTDAVLKLSLKASNAAIVLDDIFYSIDTIVNAKPGPEILTVDKPVTIESINGAKYRISFGSVYFGNHVISDDTLYEDGEYAFYNFVYKLEYLSGPTNAREVSSFDTFSNGVYKVPLVIGVQSDVDSTMLYDSIESAQRLLWSDSTDTEYYVTSLDKPIEVGGSAIVSCNRLVPKTTTHQAEYIRLRIEFPEEMVARTSDELKGFNGRYVVYQIPVAPRVLQEEPND